MATDPSQAATSGKQPSLSVIVKGWRHTTPLAEALRDLERAEMIPDKPAGSKGIFRFKQEAPIIPSETLLSTARWELDHHESAAQGNATAQDTEIVGGTTRQTTSQTRGRSCDLLIEIEKKEKWRDGSTSHHYLRWELSVGSDGTAEGPVAGFLETRKQDGAAISTSKLTFEQDGRISKVWQHIGPNVPRQQDTVISYPDGRDEWTHESGEQVEKETKTRRPFSLRDEWFSVSLPEHLRQRHRKAADPSAGFPFDDPCADPVFRRLTNEQYPEQVTKRLEELKPKYLLQSLGSRETSNVFESSTYANFDRYSITIPKEKLPESFSPAEELRRWPSNMGSVPLGNTNASDVFNSTNTFAPSGSPVQLGNIISIDIAGYPGVVNVMVTQLQANYFRLSTLETEVAPNRRLRHPVSGSREFGFNVNADGSVTFYTQGLDSPTSGPVNLIGGYRQKEGWTNFMIGLGQRFGMTEEDAKLSVERGSFGNRSLADKPECD